MVCSSTANAELWLFRAYKGRCAMKEALGGRQ
jgi:hypothetical protein